MANLIGAFALAPVVCTGTGSTAASGWSVWQMRTDSPAAKLDELDTRITITRPGLYLITYFTQAETLSRQWILNSDTTRDRKTLTPTGGAVSEVLELEGNTNQLRVVGTQPALTVRIEHLSAP